ncbi:hypothetical protein EB796_017157 [Bugula neritina]|uniref:Uncharacterized protein n=1 Tax=Bugula neritina TaxID=10212 RepID=A0A7J7JES0_BUGNE|nr:hypothetical protein EB796_017157 [Bugula neritina]
MTVIVISTATFLFSVVFLLVSTYTSESLSSYHLESSQSNKCAYCFTITMSLFSCFAVVLWTLIIAATMIPTTIISVVHFLFKSGSASCVHLPSYGIQTPIVVGVSDTQSTIQLHCNDDLEDWLEKSWILMTPLLISLGCAVLIEMVLMGFIMVVSSNGRHLYERMGYLGDTKTTHDNSNDGGRQRPPFI